ncbi:MAG TPA: hypothetical protein PK198_18740, partial [Saprospiraceae bacterium]|nr:hypothetical protein [Saprospiraceae bacterium]
MNLCELKHPLREEPGSSQLKRANDVLQAATVPIDGRTWADILDYLYRYSRQINFTDVAQSEESGAFTRSGDWRVFLENSLPFLLARISKFDGEAIDKKYARLQSDFERMPGPDTFSSLLDFCFEELIEPAFNWYETLSREERLQKEAAGTLPEAAISEFRFKRLLANTIGADLKLPLLDFIKIYQKAQRAQAVTQRNFFPFVNQQIWGLKVTDLLKPVDPTSAFDRTESARLLADEVFGKFLNILRQISRSAPDYIAESLKPLQEDFRKRHDPHLALLFTFLELFQYVQGDMNRLSEKHLDFFYRQVLRIQPKPHRPDHAHLVFEVAKHLEQYLLKKDTVFKDGKDNNKADVLFSLDKEIVLDKAAIGSLRTLYLNQVKLPAKPKSATTVNDCVSQEVIALEGVYMAPVANSADGLGQAFPENQIPNWATLGAKESKTLAPGKDKLDHHPNARIGLMLASPVLLLQEGKREIHIVLNCANVLNLDDDTLNAYINSVNKALRKPYYVLTERVLQQLANAFSFNALALLKCHLQDDEVIDFDSLCRKYSGQYSEKEKLILKCYLDDTASD